MVLSVESIHFQLLWSIVLKQGFEARVERRCFAAVRRARPRTLWLQAWDKAASQRLCDAAVDFVVVLGGSIHTVWPDATQIMTAARSAFSERCIVRNRWRSAALGAPSSANKVR